MEEFHAKFRCFPSPWFQARNGFPMAAVSVGETGGRAALQGQLRVWNVWQDPNAPPPRCGDFFQLRTCGKPMTSFETRRSAAPLKLFIVGLDLRPLEMISWRWGYHADVHSVWSTWGHVQDVSLSMDILDQWWFLGATNVWTLEPC